MPVGRRPSTQSSEPSIAVYSMVEEAVRKAISELGSGNMRDKALGYGRPRDGALAGKNNAVYAVVRINGEGEVDVPHTLGSVPVMCELKYIESAVGASPTPHAVAQPVRRSEWTASLVRMDVRQIGAGSMDNCIGTFVVKGE